MSSRPETLRNGSRIVKAYDLDEVERLLKDVKVAQCMLTEPSVMVVDEESVLKRLSDLTLGKSTDGNSCSCCQVGPFTTRAVQTAHYKDHWHIHNIKRKLFGKAPHTLGEYKAKGGESTNTSGSESEADDDPNMTATELFAALTRHCKAFFCNAKGQVFCIYRCLLHHRKEEMSLDGEGHVWAHRTRELLSAGFGRWAVLMVSGGHFAGCIFSGGVDALHKTLHSYTTRRGQGQSQSNRDSHGNAPRSAGASLRRYNQEQFLMHVQEILISWQEDLKGCALIFYRAVGSLNQAALFGKPSPLRKEDPRVRMLPFPTRKPSFKEVKRVHQTLASIEVYDSYELFQKNLLALPANKQPQKTSSNTSIETKKKEKKPPKVIDRAKSRERTPRELPTLPAQVISSEDEGPCYIDSETPAGWIKTLSEQSSNGVITNSRKDLINDINDCEVATSGSESEKETAGEQKEQPVRRRRKKKLEEKPVEKKGPKKIPTNVKRIWKAISDKEHTTLEPILESIESDLEALCNTPDPADGNTALHKAAIAAKPDMVTQILSAGGDPCIKNNQLQTPYAASPHHETRIAFRMFQAQFPDKYNYSKSQIPGPLTADQLEQEKEKKAQQKRAKRQREKERQIEKAKALVFLQLTDDEKRKSSEWRCFLCGMTLPKVPFEYDDCRFCKIPCLHSHRNIRPINKSVE
ncbi:tRNA endonuclease ANKZF1-like [Anticarsia gemmatalis]|uniref:tRNA endonuclease ANKZF1-like n=1 Tax=Anticarsia gemmatalis TaxID=129554 RepID=UPI003F7715B3